MPRVFKKTITSYWLRGDWFSPDGSPCAAGAPEAKYVPRRRVPAGTPGAVVEKAKTTNYYGRVLGQREPVPLCHNKMESERILSKLIGKSALREHGLEDPHLEHREKRLLEHLADFCAALQAKGDDVRHVADTDRLVKTFLDGIKAVYPPDLDLAKAQEWLSSLRADRPTAVLPPDKDEWKPSEAAALLGVSGQAIRATVKRCRLDAAGNGKARRYPRATVQALIDRASRGVSPETVNHYIRAMRSFLRWMVRPARRMPYNPLDGLEVLNADADRRRSRRELAVEELARLLAATLASVRTFRGLTGEARYHLYALACGTGFRAGGLAALTPDCFDLDGPVPFVILTVRSDKSRKGKQQPLPADVAELMRTWLVGKPADKPLWPGTWASDRRGAEMLRGDLDV